MNRIILKIIFSVLLIFVCFDTFSFAKDGKKIIPSEVTVEVEGRGETINGARLDALRNAISKIVGEHVSSYTIVEDFITKSDKIKAKTEGFIKNYREVKKAEKGKDGIFFAIYKVTVLTENVQQELKEVTNTTFSKSGLPSVCILGFNNRDSSFDSEEVLLATLILNNEFIRRGYPVKDKALITKLRNEDIEIKNKYIKNNIEDLSLDIANKLKSDIYVTISGNLEAIPVSSSIKVYNSYTGEIIGQEIGYGNTIDESIRTSINKILEKMDNYWKEVIENGQEYVIVLENGGGEERKKLKKILNELEYIKDLKQLNALPGHSEFSIYAACKPDDLFDEIIEYFEEKGLKLKKYNGQSDYEMRGGRVIFIFDK